MTVAKYMFDIEFEPETDEPAEVAEPEVEEEPPEPTFSEEELTAARESGRAEGHAAGRLEAQGEIEQSAANALRTIESHLATLGEAQAQSAHAAAVQALEIAATIARKTVPAIAREAAVPTIESFVGDCLGQIMEEPRIVIRVSGDVLGAVRPRIDQLAATKGFAGEIAFIAEPGMADEDCRVEWTDGGAERDAARIWREIDQMIDRFIASARSSDGDRPEFDADQTPDAGPGGEEHVPQPAETDSAETDTAETDSNVIES